MLCSHKCGVKFQIAETDLNHAVDDDRDGEKLDTEGDEGHDTGGSEEYSENHNGGRSTGSGRKRDRDKGVVKAETSLSVSYVSHAVC